MKNLNAEIRKVKTQRPQRKTPFAAICVKLCAHCGSEKINTKQNEPYHMGKLFIFAD
ncbi:hypothetical protein [Peijinzhouia sedimentorum]|tara:strand:- start:200 stop:370 length:171 start_codon:yes stop_codon:yes gene_type:complete